MAQNSCTQVLFVCLSFQKKSSNKKVSKKLGPLIFIIFWSSYQEKIKAINEKLDLSEQKLIEYASLPDIEEQLKDRMEALAAAQERQGTAEEHVRTLENAVEEKTSELNRLSQRLKMNEEHNQRLSSTVDKLLTESNERLQVTISIFTNSLGSGATQSV